MSKYTNLITNYHRGKSLFVDHVDLSTRPLIDTSTALQNLITAFEIDSAVGVQLDVPGEWIGRTRIVSQPISGIYFSLDTDGFGWDGQNDSLPPILETALNGPGLIMQIVDNQDMTISVGVFPEGDISQVSLELLAAIRQGYPTVKAAGVWAGDVQTPSIETPSVGSRFFGFDMNNDYIAGFDDGAWEKRL